MIDNYHLVYAGVILVFIVGAAIVAVVGLFSLMAGLCAAFAMRMVKRRKGALTSGSVDRAPAVCLAQHQMDLNRGSGRLSGDGRWRVASGPGVPGHGQGPWPRRHDSRTAALSID